MGCAMRVVPSSLPLDLLRKVFPGKSGKSHSRTSYFALSPSTLRRMCWPPLKMKMNWTDGSEVSSTSHGCANPSLPDRLRIRLRTLNDGEPHPSAQTPVLSCTLEPEISHHSDHWQMSITSSRLVFLRTFLGALTATAQLTVWDWTTGEVLLVHPIFLSRFLPMRIVLLAPQEQELPICDIY